MVNTVLIHKNKITVGSNEKVNIVMEKTIRFVDIVLSGLFFLLFFSVIYGLLERTTLVPYIAVWKVEWMEWDVYDANLALHANMFEGFIVFCIIFITLWVASQLIYWKIKKYRII